MRLKRVTGFVLLSFIIAVVSMGIGIATAPVSQAGDLGLTGKWNIQQKNSGGAAFSGVWTLAQEGSVITGTAAWQNHLPGVVEGKIEGNSLELTISYSGGLTGSYTGIISKDCLKLVKGKATSNRGDETATWVGDRQIMVTGNWLIRQKNANGATYQGDWVLAQRDSNVTGTAKWVNHPGGSIKGKIAGNNLDVTVSYPDGLKGFYKGNLRFFCTKQTISGTATANRGNDTATWTAEGK